MTAFILAFLTVVLVLNCFFLILLVLAQLPKKDAGIGMAFGGGATEALFGAGTGTVLTRATKYSVAMFMGLSLFLSMMNAATARRDATLLDDELRRLSETMPGLPEQPAVPLMVPEADPSPDPVEPVPLLLSPSEGPATTPPPLLLEPTRPPE